MWYLLNGSIIHMLMDGGVGSVHVLPAMDKQYKRLDKRFTRPLGDERGSCIWLVGMLELCVKGPLCLLLYKLVLDWYFFMLESMR